ncbi:MAG: aminoacyl-tRNA hydrolase [Patescibacteria group bacterium]|nr:aminoacyl-tRNA hydrolase [Patescibacteria group bacterium]MCX7589934.1 aminoacyl-tRNA hydrolase [Patescibacteria group bacterium]MDW8279788.1 aminoacyl-tRNA hydrolase [bacterium]
MEIDLKNIKAIIGLGNPTEKYQNTYHNVGKLTINYIVQKLNIKKFKSEKYFRYYNITTNTNDTIYIIDSQTFMNESNLVVQKVIEKFQIKSKEILIIHDDSDLQIGKFKYVFARGSAGHHGIESIFKSLKTKNFWRLRIGIRPINSSQKTLKAEKFVLKNINKKDKKIFYCIVDGLIEKLIKNVLPSS